MFSEPGSSPLARGTPRARRRKTGGTGLIPARAGNTIDLPPGEYTARAHPRSRGEHGGWLAVVSLGWGSSPLARGTHFRRDCRLLRLGLIPARAGNTWRSLALRLLQGAHPRSRGEHAHRRAPLHVVSGSSPLARGTPMRLRRLRAWMGLIPARAGNTVIKEAGIDVNRAHPRSRGEHTC